MAQYHNQPIHPQQLLTLLLNTSLFPFVCQCEADHLNSKKQNLINIITQYENELIRKKQQIDFVKHLESCKINLLNELESLKEERRLLEGRIATEIDRLRCTPLEGIDKIRVHEDMVIIQDKNAKLQVRIQQILEYIARMEMHNSILERQRQVVDLRDKHIYDDSWRERMTRHRQQQDKFMRDFRMRMKEKQQMALRSVQHQQNQIIKRNKMRWGSYSPTRY